MKHFAGNIEQPAYAMEWRVCPRFTDYEVSECGDMRRVVACYNRAVGFRLRGFINLGGYPAYALTPDGGSRVENIPAYRLVAEAFHGLPPSPEYEVAHRNGSKIGARYTDLRWATRKDNDSDMAVHGTHRSGQRNGRATVTDEQALDIRREYQRIKREGGGNRQGLLAALCKKHGATQRVVRAIGMNETWRHLPATVD